MLLFMSNGECVINPVLADFFHLRGSAGNNFGFGIRFLQFEYIFYYFFGLSYNAGYGWSSAKYMDNTQWNLMWTLAGISLAMVLAMLGLMAYVFWSFASNTFAAGVLPLRILRFLGDLILNL